MAQKIDLQVKRCTSSNRTTYTPLQGELLLETDTNNLYVGDGSTAGGVLVSSAGSSGESNTASNTGTSGVGVFKQKTGIDLEFKKINSGSNKVSITDDSGNDEVDIDINEGNFTDLINKSEFDAKGDILVGTADNTFEPLTTGTDGHELVADSGETSGLKWQEHRSRGQMKARSVNTNTTVLVTDQVIFVDTTSGDITITLPLSTAYPADGYLYELWVKNASGSNDVIIQLSGGEIFSQGHNKVILHSNRMAYHMGAMNGGGWSNVDGITVAIETHRNTDWNSSNFSSYTAIPWNHTDLSDNDAIMDDDISGSNPSRIECKTAGRYCLSYHLAVDSTGGSTWNLNSRIRINGSSTIDSSETRTGNYGGEDGSLSIGFICVDLDANDYLELELEQTNLTGNVISAVLHVNTTI